MAKKLINVGGGYQLRFDQRARGQETPYYVGVIFKDGKEVGHFNNGGTGGPTTIRPVAVSEAFEAMVDAEAKRQGYKKSANSDERDAEVINFGAKIASLRGAAAPVAKLWEGWIEQFIEEKEMLDDICAEK